MKYIRGILKGDNVDEVISKYGLEFKCDFAFYDLVYVNRNGTPITDDTLKIRVYQSNHWKSKDVLVIRKVAPLINVKIIDEIELMQKMSNSL